MPKRTDIESILILGSGPIVIGQACEFDYSGTQACRVLRSLGYRIVLVNSNPATIMTDPELAHRTYIEPLTPEIVAQIIEREKPHALLPTMGGQTSLNLAYALARKRRPGSSITSNSSAPVSRPSGKPKAASCFAASMRRVGLEVPRGRIVRSLDEAFALVEEIDFPVILRPAFTLGGTGGGTAYRPRRIQNQNLPRPRPQPGARSAGGRIRHRLEGVRAGGHAGPPGQLRGRLLD